MIRSWWLAALYWLRYMKAESHCACLHYLYPSAMSAPIYFTLCDMQVPFLSPASCCPYFRWFRMPAVSGQKSTSKTGAGPYGLGNWQSLLAVAKD